MKKLSFKCSGKYPRDRLFMKAAVLGGNKKKLNCSFFLYLQWGEQRGWFVSLDIDYSGIPLVENKFKCAKCPVSIQLTIIVRAADDRL